MPECILSKTLSNFKNRHEAVEIANQMCWQKCIWFQSSNLKSKSREHVTTNFGEDSRICLTAYFPRHFQTSKNRHEVVEIFNKMHVSAKMHLGPVIQLEIEIARTRRHQLLRRQSHLPECMLSKTLSNFRNKHEVVKIFNKMHVSAKMHLVPVIQLEIEIARRRRK